MSSSEQRATIFGSEAASYDAHRPGYPSTVIDMVVVDDPELAVDAGCGTGKAARSVADRGTAVIGVEPDERMAAVARGHGLTVTVSKLEAWDVVPCDVMYSAQAWHWIDPVCGAMVAASSIRPGGSWIGFWNYEVDAEFARCRTEVYQRLAPELLGQTVSTDDDALRLPISAAFDATGAFDPLEVRNVDWTDHLSADAAVQRLASHSPHRLLDPSVSDAVNAALLHELGGDRSLELPYTTRVFSSRRRTESAHDARR